MAVAAQRGEREFAGLRSRLHVTQEGLARVLGVSSRTVARWEAGGVRPSPLAMQRIRLLKEILQRGRRLFGRNFEEWLTSPEEAFSGQRPNDRMQQPDGPEQVRDLLGRIEAGIPA